MAAGYCLWSLVKDWARERVRTAYAQMDEIDCNAALSPEDKEHQRQKIAAQAIAQFEASKTMARARGSVEFFIQQWRKNTQHVSSETVEVTLKAMKEADTGWRRAMNKIVERAAQTKALGGARRGALISGRI